jgi:hypothetical protein
LTAALKKGRQQAGIEAQSFSQGPACSFLKPKMYFPRYVFGVNIFP